MARPLLLSVLSPSGPLVPEREVGWLQARLADGGSIGIWPGHAPLLAETEAGRIRYHDGAREQSLDLQAGILHVDESGATILTPGTAGDSGSGLTIDPAQSRADQRSGG